MFLCTNANNHICDLHNSYKDCFCRQKQIKKIYDYIGHSFEGNNFNKLFSECAFIKLTNKEEQHNGFKYNTGLNTLVDKFNNEQCSNGLYFTELQYIYDWTTYGNKTMKYVRFITIPNNANVIIENHNKFKCDKFILSERIEIDKLNQVSKIKICEKCTSNKNNYRILQIKENYRIIYDIPKCELTQKMCEEASKIYPPVVIHLFDEFKSDTMKKRYTDYCRSIKK
jgi:hypothetical protein